MTILSNFDVMLILSVIILIVLLAVVFVYILEKLEKEKTNAKNYRKRVLTKFIELIRMKNGETHYVLSESTIKYNEESVDNLIERLPAEWRDKAGEVYREILKD